MKKPQTCVKIVKGEVLLRNLKIRNARMETKINDMILNKNSGGLSLKEQFESDIASLGEKIHNLGLDELVVRENEVKIFEESIEAAQDETQQKGVKTIDAFLKGESNLISKKFYTSVH